MVTVIQLPAVFGGCGVDYHDNDGGGGDDCGDCGYDGGGSDCGDNGDCCGGGDCGYDGGGGDCGSHR